MSMAPLAARIITPQVAHIQYDNRVNMWRVKASRQEDSSSGHFDVNDIERLLTLAEVIAWLIRYWASTSPTEIANVAAPLGELNKTFTELAEEYTGF
jgi:hypothetical protein